MHKKTLRLMLTSTFLLLALSSYSQYDSIPYGGNNRTFLVHLPTGYTGNTNLPLVIAMHGGFGSGPQLENQSQLSVKSDNEGFIVVYPEGVKSPLGIRTWNAGWCCGYASNSNVDDVGFINALLDTLINNYAIDTNKVYATGMSNGGFMSYRLACELSERIAAIAPVAASMTMTSCNPQRPMPIISFHSYLDTNIPYNGGVGSGFSNHYSPPQDSVLNAWASMNGCLILNDTIIDNSQYTHINWNNCNCNAEIQQYITQDGGHSWPGGNQSPGGDPVSNYINATDLMWPFFQQFSLDCNPLSISNKVVEDDLIKVFPNPSNKLIKIQPYKGWKNIQVSFFNLQGKEILSTINQTEIDISSLSNGLVLMKVEIDNNVKTYKLLKTE